MVTERTLRLARLRLGTAEEEKAGVAVVAEAVLEVAQLAPGRPGDGQQPRLSRSSANAGRLARALPSSESADVRIGREIAKPVEWRSKKVVLGETRRFGVISTDMLVMPIEIYFYCLFLLRILFIFDDCLVTVSFVYSGG